MARLLIDELVYLDSNTRARYLGMTKGDQHKFVNLEQPFNREYMSAIPVNIKPCKARKVYASMMFIDVGEWVLFETNKGLCRDKVALDMGSYFLMDSGFKLPKNKAFIYETGDHLQSTIQSVLQDETDIDQSELQERVTNIL